MNGHQEWLEAPYTDAARRQDEFEKWCEVNDVDPDADNSWDAFEAFLAEQYDDEPLEAPIDWDES